MAIFVPELLAWWRILWLGKAGALAIAVASPTDLVKVRLQAEGKLPPGVPRRYSGAMNAYSTIAKQVYFQWHTLLVLQGVWYVYLRRAAQQKHLLSFITKPPVLGSCVIMSGLRSLWFLLLHLILCCHQEGVTKLWTGLGPNVARNAIINAAELASYDQVKQVNININKSPLFIFSTLWDISRGPWTSCTFFQLQNWGI
jgi:hypothetical protein